ncbi:MAG: 50S ribosomal protein L11 methyltransferase [Xanthobacteraceae bacterium]|nr:50S ribosomal protein L11 methyltransferase [Xanthobacteraceae bacterium]
MAVDQSNDDAPRHILQLLKDAAIHHSNGDLEKAEEGYLRVLGHDYRTADILPVLARIVSKRGAPERALRHWNSLLELNPLDLDALIEKGVLLHRLGRAGEAVECFVIARSIAPGNELVLSNLAVALADSGQRDEAFVEFRRISELQPGNIHVRHQMRRLASRIVPFWHIPMLNDVRRNDAFELAICKAVEKEGRDARILDIGTGSGLLSMMAARAGATNIVTCESIPVIAETAVRIVTLNGYEKQIRIVNKSSNQLVVGEDLEGRADILISEILSSDLLAEDVLSVFEDAHARLLRQGATIIPRAATAVGCLVESDILANYAFVGDVAGFDVSPFNTLSAQRLPVHGTMTSWRRLSRDTELLRIDLTAKEHETEIRKLSISVLEDGVAIGIVQWINVDLAEGIAFSNHPDDYSDGGWLQVLHTFPQPISVTAGEQLDVMVGNDRTSLIVMPAPRSPNGRGSKMAFGGRGRRGA